CCRLATSLRAVHISVSTFPTRRSPDLHRPLPGVPVDQQCSTLGTSGRAAPRPGQSGGDGPCPSTNASGPWPALRIPGQDPVVHQDRKSTRLNSSHVKISYAVFCFKKKS